MCGRSKAVVYIYIYVCIYSSLHSISSGKPIFLLLCTSLYGAGYKLSCGLQGKYGTVTLHGRESFERRAACVRFQRMFESRLEMERMLDMKRKLICLLTAENQDITSEDGAEVYRLHKPY